MLLICKWLVAFIFARINEAALSEGSLHMKMTNIIVSLFRQHVHSRGMLKADLPSRSYDFPLEAQFCRVADRFFMLLTQLELSCRLGRIEPNKIDIERHGSFIQNQLPDRRQSALTEVLHNSTHCFLIIVQLLKNLSVFYGTIRSITVFSQHNPTQFL
jgi:hypothetical protein